VGKIINTD